MPRKFYRRKYSYKPKRKWNSNFYTYADHIIWPIIQANEQFVERVQSRTLFSNPQIGNASTSTSVVKIKNCKVQFAGTGFVDAAPTGLLSMQVALIYVPEGVDYDAGILFRHPEWILAHKLVTCDADQSLPINFSISSRLARNLNSGDRIELVFIPRINTAGAAGIQHIPGSMAYYATVQYWTCVN